MDFCFYVRILIPTFLSGEKRSPFQLCLKKRDGLLNGGNILARCVHKFCCDTERFFFIYSSVGICASYSYLGFHCEIQPYWFLWGYIPYKGHSVYLERAFLLPASNLSPLNLMSAPHSRLLELSQRKITLSNEQLDLSNIKWILIVVADAKKNNSAT